MNLRCDTFKLLVLCQQEDTRFYIHLSAKSYIDYNYIKILFKAVFSVFWKFHNVCLNSVSSVYLTMNEQQRVRDGSKSFFASPSQVTSYFLASPSQVTSQLVRRQVKSSQVTSHFRPSPSQVTSQLVRRQVKSSHKSFGPNTSQVTSLFVQVPVKSHIISSTPVIRRGI